MYGLPSSSFSRAGGVLSKSNARFGSGGAGKWGTEGEDVDVSPSAVEAVDKAGDPGVDCLVGGTGRPSCAEARGGSGDDNSSEDVFGT